MSYFTLVKICLCLRYHSFLRHSIRGYYHLRKNNQLYLVRTLRSSLANTAFLTNPTLPFSNHLFLKNNQYYEFILRQYIFQKFVGTFLNKVICFSVSTGIPIIYPLPRKWLLIISQHGFNVNNRLSLCLWYLSIFSLIGLNFTRVFIFLIRISFAVHNDSLHRSDSGVMFLNLSHNQIPHTTSQGNQYTIVDWYIKWKKAIKTNTFLFDITPPATSYNSYYLKRSRLPYLQIDGWYAKILLLNWSIFYLFRSVINLFFGKWWQSLLFFELTLSKSVSLCRPESLANDYLFHYSGLIYRPLWTYPLSAHKIRVICYFYSTFEQPSSSYGSESQSYEWPASTWDHFLVWDSYHKNLISSDVSSHALIDVVGPIWFSDYSLPITIPDRSFAVFDVQAHRVGSHLAFSTVGDLIYHHPDFSQTFFYDILYVLKKYNIHLAIKSKRNIGRRGTKSYAKLLTDLSLDPSVVFIDTKFSPLKLIDKCQAIISMPFTSTALYGLQTHKPSIYYDSTGWVDKNDKASHGLPVLAGRHNLENWLVNCYPSLF